MLQLYPTSRHRSSLDLVRVRELVRVLLAASARADATVEITLDVGREQLTLLVSRWSPGLHDQASTIEDDDAELAAALRIRDEHSRIAALDRVLAQLDDDLEHPAWHLLDRRSGAPAFELFARVARNPRLALLLLFRAGEAGFDRVWMALEELPFVWDLLPISAWVSAARAFASGWQGSKELLDFIVPHFDRLATLAARRSLTAPLAFQCIRARVFGLGSCAEQLEGIASSLGPQLLAERDEAQSRLSPSQAWPAAPAVLQLDEMGTESPPRPRRPNPASTPWLRISPALARRAGARGPAGRRARSCACSHRSHAAPDRAALAEVHAR
ncbi:MAG: hypothetical protein HC927_04250 [Deltaproteobacteria bacterium]|nr:hypothetical protein [Deltaproteobacteria bacterium]